MSNITRLSRFANIDHVSSKERLLFTDRRRPWYGKPFWLPLIFFALLALWAVTTHAETVSGVTRGGMAFVITRFETGPLLEFTLFLTTERL